MRAIAAGWALVVALLAVVTRIAARFAAGSTATSIAQVRPDEPQVNVMVYGIVGSLTLGTLLAWFLMRPVASSFRRFGLSMVAALGGFLLAMILTTGAHQVAGGAGLLVLAVVGAAACWHFARRALLLQ